MRITNGMLTSRALSDLQGNFAAMARAQEQVSSAKRLNRPSDNPADVQAAIKLNDSLASMAQYLRNIGLAQRYTSAAETALGSAGDTVQRLKELSLQAATATTSPADRLSILQEVNQLTEHLVSLANTKMGTDYVFSGQKTGTPAYANATAAYAGDQGPLNARVSGGVSLRVNVTADVAFGPALAAANQLATELAAGTAPQPSTIAALDGGLDSLVNARTNIGAFDKRLSDAASFLGDAQVSATAMLSQLVDADMASVISEAANRQVTYQAAISVNAKILQKSLINEL
jgi:flagellar hook-associated protein 3 FlgL